MKKHFLFLTIAAFVLCQNAALAQQQGNPPQPARTPAPTTQATTPTTTQQRSTGFDLAEFGVRFDADPRLIVVMAALDAAGFDPTPTGSPASLFRETVRRDSANLNSDLRTRLQAFYQRNKLPAPATPAEQAARYVSLALALGAPPTFEAPARSEDLPTGLLEVLDFASLVREFYKQSGMEERLPEYIRATRAEGDRLRRPTADMMRAVLNYLRTRPTTAIIERVATPAPSEQSKKKKTERPINLTREKERRFLIVPDLLSPPGTINFRIIGDDYYAIVHYGIDPASSELRRAYLQYVIDPLVLRYNRDIAARRADIKMLLDERRAKSANDISPDVFLAVGRSLVAAADTRMVTQARLAALSREAEARLNETRADASARAAVTKAVQEARQTVDDAATAQLAEAFERGAVLSFHFAEQLRGMEDSGFDIANFMQDMLTSFSVTRETRRPVEYAAARERYNAARAQAARVAEANRNDESETPVDARRAALTKSLNEVNELLRLKNHEEAETRLRALMPQYQGEPRIFFALGQTVSLAAADAFDENLQAERLTRALGHYRMAVNAASPDSDRALISRAHMAMGRILAFLERRDEALKEFDAAIALGRVEGGAYDAALAEKKKLQP
ncbi:MAG TPA: hypothetical protein VF666_20035 [Pyrinomonadaceae bacterium]|jgi:hypothetical protein